MANVARNAPEILRKTLGSIGRVIKTRFLKTMKSQGGQFGVDQFQPWAPLTWRLRMGATNRAGQMGGKLGEKYAIQMFKKGQSVTVGWISAFTKYIDAFQSAEASAFTKAMRYQFHREGLHEIGSYNRPARQLVDPFASFLTPKVADWISSMLEKELKKKFPAGRFANGEKLPEFEGID